MGFSQIAYAAAGGAATAIVLALGTRLDVQIASDPNFPTNPGYEIAITKQLFERVATCNAVMEQTKFTLSKRPIIVNATHFVDPSALNGYAIDMREACAFQNSAEYQDVVQYVKGVIGGGQTRGSGWVVKTFEKDVGDY